MENISWNTTPSLNSSTDISIESALNYTNIVSYSLVLITGVFGNIAVLCLFILRRKRHKPFDVYIVCLGLADLLGVIIISKNALHLHLRKTTFPFGVIGCKVDLYLSSVSITVSAATLVAISVDRYIGIKWPLQKYLNTSKTILINTMIWLYGSAIAVVFLLRDKVDLDDHDGVQICVMNYTDNNEEKNIIFPYFILQSGIPLLLLIIVYSLIVHELYSSANIFLCSAKRRARFLQNKKTTKLVFFTVISSVVCLTPSRVLYLVYVLDEHFVKKKLFVQLYSFLQMLTMVNNCLNPVIYTKYHSILRKQLTEQFQSMSSIGGRLSSTISRRSTLLYSFIRRANTTQSNEDTNDLDETNADKCFSELSIESRIVLDNIPTCSSSTKVCLFLQKINEEAI